MTAGRRRAASWGEGELLSRLCQQVTELQAARFAAGYDVASGLDRYRAWLGEHAAGEPSRPKVIPLQGSTPLRAAFADSSAGTAAAVTGGPVVVSETTLGSTGTGTAAAGAGWEVEQAVTALYGAHYRSLVRLADLLVRDYATAEEVVQDSFVALHGAWPLRDNEKALSYLRQSVVKRSRSVPRDRVIVDKTAPKPAPDLPAARQTSLAQPERSALAAALQTLPPPQREALVLWYYADLSLGEIASAMGISVSAVMSHTARATASLRALLEMDT